MAFGDQVSYRMAHVELILSARRMKPGILVSGLNYNQARMISGLAAFPFPRNSYWDVRSTVLNDGDDYSVKFEFLTSARIYANPSPDDLMYLKNHTDELKEVVRLVKDEKPSRFSAIRDMID